MREFAAQSQHLRLERGAGLGDLRRGPGILTGTHREHAGTGRGYGGLVPGGRDASAVFFAATVLAPVCFFAVFAVFAADALLPAAFFATGFSAAGSPAVSSAAGVGASASSATAFRSAAFATEFFAAGLFATDLCAAVVFSATVGGSATVVFFPATSLAPSPVPVEPAAEGFFAAVFFATMSRPLHIL